MGNLILPIGNPLTAQIGMDDGKIWLGSIFVGLTIILIKKIDSEGFLSWAEKALWAYLSVYALAFFEAPLNVFGVYNTAYQLTAAKAFAEILLIPIGVVAFKDYFLMGLIPIALYEIVVIWLDTGHGLLIAPSFDAAFLAASLPLLPTFFGPPVVLTLLFHRNSTALLILFSHVAVGAYYLKSFRKYMPLYLIAFLATGYLNLENVDQWLSGNGRFEIYQKAFTFWLSEARHIWIGVGPGTFMWTNLLLNRFEGEINLQMHSDWLQILWEYGAVGIGLTLWVFIEKVKENLDRPEKIASLFGLAAFGLTYHPLRFFPTQMLVAFTLLNCKRPSYLLHQK